MKRTESKMQAVHTLAYFSFTQRSQSVTTVLKGTVRISV